VKQCLCHDFLSAKISSILYTLVEQTSHLGAELAVYEGRFVGDGALSTGDSLVTGAETVDTETAGVDVDTTGADTEAVLDVEVEVEAD
jgi:hypothetical protein